MKNESIIGLTYGDPSSIGPEILFKTLKNWKFKLKPLVIGWLNRNLKKEGFVLGSPSKYSGKHAYECLKGAALAAKNEKISALFTGPVSKSAINSAGVKFVGQTDELAKFFKINPDNVIMLFAAKDFRIALFTRHISLKAVSREVSKRKLEDFIVLLNSEMKKWFSIKNPKIGLLGLNPHAGEGGIFGDEEVKIISPLIKDLNKKGFRVFGPLSPDATLATAGKKYLSGKKQDYDVFISLYHDQALPLFKAICGFNGVNITLGLPFLRVSVDHGTAFDIAGKGKASNEGMVSAIKLVEKLLSYQR